MMASAPLLARWRGHAGEKGRQRGVMAALTRAMGLLLAEGSLDEIRGITATLAWLAAMRPQR